MCPLSFACRLRHTFSILITNGPVCDASFPRSFISTSRFEFVCEIWKIQSLRIFQNGPSNCFLSTFYRRERLWISGDNGETQNSRTGTDNQLDRDSFFELPAASLGGLQRQSSQWPWRGGSRWGTGGLACCSAPTRRSSGRRGGQCFSSMGMRLNARFNSPRVSCLGFAFQLIFLHFFNVFSLQL